MNTPQPHDLKETSEKLRVLLEGMTEEQRKEFYFLLIRKALDCVRRAA